MQSPHVVVAGGGTAGHIEPAMAVAEELRGRGANVIALGTSRGLEQTIVPARGFELKLIDPVPVPRKINADLFKLPFRLLRTVKQTRDVLKAHDASVLIGFGGYVSAPGYLAAKTLGIPYIVHEANARSGMANKLGVRMGGLGLNAVAGSGMPGRVVGIPIRNTLKVSSEARERGLRTWGLDPARKTVLVTGGSQGAASINRAVAGGIDSLLSQGYQILHSYGAKNDVPSAREHYVPVPYIEDMAAAYSVSDLIVCRAGAMTVAENTAAGIPAIYVPLPHGNGEQGLNAADIVAAGGAILIDDESFDGDACATSVGKILSDPEIYRTMKEAVAHSQAGNAAAIIADIVYHIVKDHDAEHLPA
ncbi:UDP-N-acetylglucosamine--N-acetylmuramyl- pentapeptide pyrophosphoryl-undecaprenol N- acetylglucosamine transferase [Corynebacterium ulcerans 809]|uniref:undecaprenyldiphospho-muramoylpentapeptide beta-N-acetylglucosaminyltransferase n=1 Tax=Corynebacterium ulcerans TaxID=65058 RepID=UPI0002185222|nr:undecaprenyldiphospho-muramoylpentapeptide beta-N-acetylglucosaminyltransferase [Corynebacterium ulcerans]AEG82028.1 UDP-N-acetylglucosamine--N-acetylmuramyl- pentapeptide pyrophosphoryl-undecaprenol N- acetylglucosamine transferase [Corynebacterium ulcerans 809]